MKIHYLIITILSISMIVLGSVGYLNNLGSNYGATADLSSLNQTQSRMNQTRENAMELSDTITDFELTPQNFFLIPYVLIQVAWSATLVMFNSWATLQAMIVDLGTGLQVAGVILPNWFIPTLVSIFVVILVFILVYGFFKWKFDDK